VGRLHSRARLQSEVVAAQVEELWTVTQEVYLREELEVAATFHTRCHPVIE
jgi:hypothetical protein